ncbi:ATP-dependent (S)-NAD(P)H-hydrate dehydratase-like [Limulus polyphemus]|uniref:ATP-dependent (S)-NAD(P)H-hydrate dehydratase n=1 Tax=Limulus polyphemus TaxID=6850 RepID=A0ABM1C047_LIMPO|nr:ATP-dependent (S)-NAD(P)H-hydrate dehydratase-like [Limulus polyphemus]
MEELEASNTVTSGSSTFSEDMCLTVEQKLIRLIIPPLTFVAHKGQAGRIGIIGGSREYTGAPYFAGISALKTGADLCHVFCTSSAASVIKSYSPELIVHPVLDSCNDGTEFGALISKLHALVIGPGLGREENTFSIMHQVVEKAKELQMPIVFDADSLFYINSHPELVEGYKKAVLTPNVVEFSRLYKAVIGADLGVLEDLNMPVQALSQKLGNVTIVCKGIDDIISDGDILTMCKEKGSPRRCGGQGDLLSGSLGTMLHWAHMAHDQSELVNFSNWRPNIIAAVGACMLTRRCNYLAFQKYSRSMTTTDMIVEIQLAFTSLFS